MDLFFAPAYYVLARLRNEVKFGFMATVFGIPAYIFTWMERTPINSGLGSTALVMALYFGMAFYTQAMKGWKELLPLLDCLSKGDLTGIYGDTADRVGQFAEMRFLASDVNAHFSSIVAQARS